MKVITLKQPCASMVAYNLKTYEIRNWKTNYRGELYIHAGNSINKDNKCWMNQYDIPYPKSMIIAKCNLVDCIEVDEKFMDELKKIDSNIYKNNYIGQYAWNLENIELLDEPIPAKGQLSIWNYEN